MISWCGNGELAEWSIASVLKTEGLHGPRGSNPLLSAYSGTWNRTGDMLERQRCCIVMGTYLWPRWCEFESRQHANKENQQQFFYTFRLEIRTKRKRFPTIIMKFLCGWTIAYPHEMGWLVSLSADVDGVSSFPTKVTTEILRVSFLIIF